MGDGGGGGDEILSDYLEIEPLPNRYNNAGRGALRPCLFVCANVCMCIDYQNFVESTGKTCRVKTLLIRGSVSTKIHDPELRTFLDIRYKKYYGTGRVYMRFGMLI